tara:strand:+ start:728 stop:904 length:177 start_codon:yes stop_codon:yes gene_type:complete
MKTDLQYIREAVDYVESKVDVSSDITKLMLSTIHVILEKADLEKTKDLMNIELKAREE